MRFALKYIGMFLEEATTRSLHVRKSKTVLEPRGEGALHAVDSGRFQVLHSGFHSPGFQVP